MKKAAQELISREKLLIHTLRNVLIALFLIAIALGIGVWGYHYYDNLDWLDAFVNASMILSGMGPLGDINTDAGKVFAGCYALFSGLFFILIIGLLLSPFTQHYFKKWHLEIR